MKKNNSFERKKNDGQYYWMYGRNPVLQALLNKNRINKNLLLSPQAEKLLLQREDINIADFSYKVLSNEQIAAFLPDSNRNHQGIALLTKPLLWPALEQFLSSLKKEKATILVLDQLTDPQNIGAIFRLALAFGADAVITQERHSPAENAVIAKAAAGAVELVPRIVVANISSALQTLKEHNFWAITLAGDGKDMLHNSKQFDRKCFVLGAEGAGVRPLVKKNCDMVVRIPTSPLVESLNVATACAIALYTNMIN